jgi:pyridoxamine 5'-phosphate oxidase
MSTDRLAQMRHAYGAEGLDEDGLAADWLGQFERWLSEAVAAGLAEPNAMVLATADAAGQPSARTVLLKAVDARGFVLFTDRRSRKGCALAENPTASLLFPWHALQRQVEVTGAVELVGDEDSDAYFATRPRGSQLSAAVSPQSSVIGGRDELERARDALAAQLGEGGAPGRPPHWGGVRVLPRSVEFWQGRADRLHDRLRYRRGDDGCWLVERLAP